MNKKPVFIAMIAVLILMLAAPAPAQIKRMEVKKFALLAPPQQISPADNSHFTHFPRTLTLKWNAVEGAMYDVEIDCMHCRVSGQWDSQNGPALHVASNLNQTFLNYTFPGDNQGRWRVRTVKGTAKSNWSPWWNFDFKTGSGGGTGPATPAPQRFFLDFRDCYLVYAHGSNTLQIAAQSNVLSYGGDWERIKMKDYLYALRLKTWAGFWWKINTSRKEVYQITGVPFGQMGGTEKTMPITVEPQGSPDNPTQFLLRFQNAYLVYDVGSKSIQVIAELIVLSYASDFQKCNLSGNIYQLKQNVWQGFYWEVNTVEKAAFRVNGGAFCSSGGGSRERLNIGVRVVN